MRARVWAERCARWRTGFAPGSRLGTMAKLSKKRKDSKEDAKSSAKSAILGVVGRDAWKSTKRDKPCRRRLLKLGAKLPRRVVGDDAGKASRENQACVGRSTRERGRWAQLQRRAGHRNGRGCASR